jgi:hypothetical protein
VTIEEVFNGEGASAAAACGMAIAAYNGELKNVLIGIRRAQAAAGADPSAGSAGSGSQDTGANRNLGLFSVGAGLAGVRFPDTPSGGVGSGGGNKFPDTPSGGVGAGGGNKFPDTPSGGAGAEGNNQFPDTPSGGAGSGSEGNVFPTIPITGGG